jgi:hypothetical protein
MDNKDKTTTNSNTPTDPGLAQRQARRANLFLHVRVLLQYLTRVDPKLRVEAQNALKICHLKNRSGDPNYKSLVDSIERRVRLAVGEKHWVRSRAIQIRSLGKREPHPVSNNQIKCNQL